MIKEINGRFTCTECGHEGSAMLGDNEIPETCECESNCLPSQSGICITGETNGGPNGIHLNRRNQSNERSS